MCIRDSRLRVAGSTSDIFTPAALREIYRLSGGVPRVINVICDRALLGAYTQDRHHVTGGIVRRASAEVLGRHVAPSWLPWAITATAFLTVAIGAVALYRFAPWGRVQHAAPVPTVSAQPVGPPAAPAADSGQTNTAAKTPTEVEPPVAALL